MPYFMSLKNFMVLSIVKNFGIVIRTVRRVGHRLFNMTIKEHKNHHGKSAFLNILG